MPPDPAGRSSSGASIPQNAGRDTDGIDLLSQRTLRQFSATSAIQGLCPDDVISEPMQSPLKLTPSNLHPRIEQKAVFLTNRLIPHATLRIRVQEVRSPLR